MSAIPALREAIVGLLREALPDARVNYGPTELEDQPVQVAYIKAARIVRNGMAGVSGGSRRSRDEEVEIDVALSFFTAGDTESSDDAQAESVAGAYAMYDALEDVFRSRESQPLVLGSRLEHIESASDEILPAVEDDGENGTFITGWICDVTATINTTVRLS